MTTSTRTAAEHNAPAMKIRSRRRPAGYTLAAVSVAALGLLPALVPAQAASASVPTCAGLPATHVGGAGNDVIIGTDFDDVIVTGPGNDQVASRLGDDVICLGTGNDFADAGGGADRVYAGPGADVVQGGSGSDRMWGDDGPDTLTGQLGVDWANGGLGADNCSAENLLNCP